MNKNNTNIGPAGFSLTPNNSLSNAANPLGNGQIFGNSSSQSSNTLFGAKAQGQSSPFGTVGSNEGSIGGKVNIFNNDTNQVSSTTNNNQTPNSLFNNSVNNTASQQASSTNASQTMFGAKNQTPPFSGNITPMFVGANTSNPLAGSPITSNSQSSANLLMGQK